MTKFAAENRTAPVKMEKHIAEFNTYLHSSYVDMWGEIIRKYGTPQTFRRGEEFITAGETARYIGLIDEGAVKYVVYTPEGEERVIGLETVGGYAASFPYSLRGLPSIFSVVVTADSEICCAPVQQIVELSRTDDEFGRVVGMALEAVFYNIYDRYVSQYAHSPRERYEQLLQSCPRLFDIFQLKDIASYLNITPQYLRRLKK